MSEARSRAPVPGAALARLLARMSGLDATPPARSPAERLGDWLEWQRAVALSRALDAEPASGELPAATRTADDGIVAECLRVRVGLEAAITDDARDWTLPLRPRAGDDGAGAAAGAAAVQRHCQHLQRDMQSASGRLRGVLRQRLERRGGEPARLAGVDAVMEGLLAPREHALLAPTVPALVARFEQLHARHGADDHALPTGGAAWRTRFRTEARQLQLAELDLRFQPIEALLAALRSHTSDA